MTHFFVLRANGSVACKYCGADPALFVAGLHVAGEDPEYDNECDRTEFNQKWWVAGYDTARGYITALPRPEDPDAAEQWDRGYEAGLDE